MTSVSESAEPDHLPPGTLAVLRRIVGIELRDPLQVLLIDGVRLGRDSIISEDHRQMSRRIVAAGHRIEQLQTDIDDLLAGILGRPLELQCRASNADEICQAAILRCKTRSASLSVEYKPLGNPSGDWDAPRIQRVIELLLEGVTQPEIRLAWHRAPRSSACHPDWVIEIARSVPGNSAGTLAELHARYVAQAHEGDVKTMLDISGIQHVRMRLPCRSLSSPVN